MYKITAGDEPVMQERIIVTIFGDPGMGKTSLGFTTNNPLLLDYDEGAQRAVGRKGSVRFEKWEDTADLLASGAIQENDIKTLIIDTAGTMLDNYLALYVGKQDKSYSKRAGGLTLQGYGALKHAFHQFLAKTKSLKINLVFICHATSKTKSGDVEYYMPKLTGGSSETLKESTDLMGYIYSYNDKRVIDFRSVDNHDGKDCAEIGVLEIPHYTDASYEGFLQRVIDKTLARMNEGSDEHAAFLDKLKQIKATLETVSDADKLNEWKQAIESEYEGSQKLQAMALFKKRCRVLMTKNVVEFDKESGLFISKEVTDGESASTESE